MSSAVHNYQTIAFQSGELKAIISILACKTCDLPLTLITGSLPSTNSNKGCSLQSTTPIANIPMVTALQKKFTQIATSNGLMYHWECFKYLILQSERMRKNQFNGKKNTHQSITLLKIHLLKAQVPLFPKAHSRWGDNSPQIFAFYSNGYYVQWK